MAQSATTVTPPSPSPPTNMSSTGASMPNPPNYTKNTYNDSKNWGMGTIHPAVPYSPSFPANPPPFFDDGSAGVLTAYAANTSALASGSGATAGGTEDTYPGTDNTVPYNIHFGGAVPASSSVAHEGASPAVVVVTAPGSRAECPTQSVSTLGNRTTTPNADHASSLSPTTAPTFTSFTAGSSVSGVGTTTLSCVTVGATPQSVVYVNGVPQVTTFVSPTSLTCAAVTKKTTPGNWNITIVTGGVIETAPRTWTFS